MKPFLFSLTVLLGLASQANADLIFTLDTPTFSGAPGDNIDIMGTLLNPDQSSIFLNGFSGFLTNPDLDFDTTDFFTIVPAVIGNGESYSGPIAGVLVGLSGQPGNYSGSITLQGGADANAFDDLATQNFQFTVATPSAVPEPSSFGLLAGAMLALISVKLYRRSFGT